MKNKATEVVKRTENRHTGQIVAVAAGGAVPVAQLLAWPWRRRPVRQPVGQAVAVVALAVVAGRHRVSHGGP